METEIIKTDFEQLKEVIKVSLSDAAVAEMQKYTTLAVSNEDDKEGYALVRSKRLEVKNYRCQVENKRKDLKADFKKAGEMVDEAARKIIEPLKEVESHLQTQEDIVAKAEERRKAAEAERIQKLVETRVAKLQSVRATNYSIHMLGDMSEGEFEGLYAEAFAVQQAEIAAKEEADRQAKELADLKAKQEAAEKEQREKEQAAEAEKLEAIKLVGEYRLEKLRTLNPNHLFDAGAEHFGSLTEMQFDEIYQNEAAFIEQQKIEEQKAIEQAKIEERGKYRLEKLLDINPTFQLDELGVNLFGLGHFPDEEFDDVCDSQREKRKQLDDKLKADEAEKQKAKEASEQKAKMLREAADQEMMKDIMKSFDTIELAWNEIARLRKLLLEG